MVTGKRLSADQAKDQAKYQARRAARESRPWVERLGRWGYAAKGIVYILIGVLAVEVAAGVGGATTDPQGALVEIIRVPFGRFLLAAIAVGFAGYAIWCFVQAALDTENKGKDAKGIATRAGFAGIGVVNAGLAITALRLLLGTGRVGSSDAAAQGWTARLLAQPLGRWLVAIAGVVVIATGCFQLYRAFRSTFREELKLGEMSPTEERWVMQIGRLGFAALGIVSFIIGAFLIVAARQARPEQARGLGGALAALAQQPFGPWLLGIVAAGLIAYGVFMLIEARYRRMVIT